MTLCTLQDCKTRLGGIAVPIGSEAEAFITELCTVVSGLFDNETGRRLEQASYSGVRLSHSGKSIYLTFPEYPLRSVSSLTRRDASGTTTLVEGTDWEFPNDGATSDDRGRIVRIDGNGLPRVWEPGTLNYTATFSAGIDPVNDTEHRGLVDAAVTQVVWIFRRSPLGGDRLGKRGSEISDEGGQYMVDPWAPEVLHVLEKYRRRDARAI